jgi:hypothetical protein
LEHWIEGILISEIRFIQKYSGDCTKHFSVFGDEWLFLGQSTGNI